MSFSSVLTEQAEKDLKRLSPGLAERVKRKLRYFLSSPNPMEFAEPLVDLPPATHRFRIGKIRVKFFCRGNTFYVTGIGFRGNVYR